MSSSNILPDLPKIDLTFPSSLLATAAFEYTKKHTSEGVYNHTVRSAYWALILAKKLPQFAGINLETVVVSCLLHDMGWATTKEILSQDRRFEVDGADIARTWLLANSSTDGGSTEHKAEGTWDPHRIQIVWDSIALHTTGSIALYKEPEVALTHLGIGVDFVGPNFPGDAITLQEFREVVRAFPRVGFGAEDFKEVMCGLCRDKAATTFDNFVGDYGRKYGYDGKGTGKEDYERKWTEAAGPDRLVAGLESLQTISLED
jgi:hypothetical protein